MSKDCRSQELAGLQYQGLQGSATMKPSSSHHWHSWLRVLIFLLHVAHISRTEVAAAGRPTQQRQLLAPEAAATCPEFNRSLPNLRPEMVIEATATCNQTYDLLSPDGLGDKIKCCRGIASLLTLIAADHLFIHQLLEPTPAHCFDQVVDALSSKAPNVQQYVIQDCGNDFLEIFSLLTDVSSPSACQLSNKTTGSSRQLHINPQGSNTPSPQLLALQRQCNDLETISSCGICLSEITDTAVGLLSNQSQGLAFRACQLSLLLYVVASSPAGIRSPGALTCLLHLSHDEKRNSEHMHLVHTALGIAVGLTFVALACLTLAVALALWRCSRARSSLQRMFVARNSELFNGWETHSGEKMNTFKFADIKAATNNFAEDHIVGVGGFGCVYRGTLPDGRLIAVKRFNDSTADGDAEFANEAHVISSVRHRNLVVLLGYCFAREVEQGRERLLIYEYMENGSLADYLSDASRNALTWEQRKRIALGVARGICYLHRGAKPTIIHRDVKPSNILLDGQLCPRLADFGLAKINKDGATHLTTRVAGTFGYVAPEYAMYGQLTERSDVYSFGVVVLELVTGLSVLVSKSMAQARTGQCCCLSPPCLLPDWTWAVLHSKVKGLADLVDPRIRTDLRPDEMVEVELFVHVALLCAHPHPGNRAASMHEALKMLEGDTALPRQMPDRPLPLNSSTGFDPDLMQQLAAIAGDVEAR